MHQIFISLVLTVVLILPALSAFSFTTRSIPRLHRQQGLVLDRYAIPASSSLAAASSSSSSSLITVNQRTKYDNSRDSISHPSVQNETQGIERRSFFQMASVGAAILMLNQSSYAATFPKLETIRSQVVEARKQLDPVPQLIKEEKWDSIRAILITPPLSDCWSKTSKLLTSYATAIGNEIPDGDELAALELKEDALDHLRFLDMAVYNNVFNPIKTEGESGATKTLISSYYDDPVNEVSRFLLNCMCVVCLI